MDNFVKPIMLVGLQCFLVHEHRLVDNLDGCWHEEQIIEKCLEDQLLIEDWLSLEVSLHEDGHE